MKNVNILGTEYIIEFSSPADNEMLRQRNGYCDKTTKKIVIDADSSGSDLGNYSVFLKKLLRHEIIHAFFDESGLAENYEHPEIGVEETMVDWIAIQFPKMLEVFQQADCI